MDNAKMGRDIHQYKYGKFEFEWCFEQTKLKQPNIIVEKNQVVRLRGDKLSVEQQQKFIYQKARKIRDSLQNMAEIKEGDIVSGSRLKYLGRHYLVHIESDNSIKSAQVNFKYRQFKIGVNDEVKNKQVAIKKAIERFYRIKFTEKIMPRIELWQEKTGLKANEVKLHKFPARWASCSKDKVLEYHPQVMELAPKIQDYVIVHELVHTVEMTHNKRFWELVEGIYPDWKDCHERLEWEV